MIKIVAGMLIAVMVAQASIENKIQDRSEELEYIKNSYQKMDQKLGAIAQKIVQAQNEKKRLNKAIEKMQKRLKDKEQFHAKTKKEYAQAVKKLEQIKADKATMQKELQALMVKEFGLTVAMQNSDMKTKESFINAFVFDATSRYTRKKIKALDNAISKIDTQKNTLDTKTQKLQTIIARMQRDKKQLSKDKKSLDKTIASLKHNHSDYKKRLTAMQDKKSQLSSTLQELKVIATKRKKEQEKKRQAAAKRALEQKQSAAAPLKRKDKDIEVRQIGSSYNHDNLYRYRGPKTISPLSQASITRNFGTYTDPIYNIKIFNESIVLKPKSNPANVRNVLNGEILYAQDTNMLGKVVIIKHEKSMHTIYAGLSKIAPGIRPGKRVAKGFVIGRVKDELTFEATKNSRHLNPVRLISLR